MDLSDCKHLIVFGGSFDPPHRAHVALPDQVRRKLGADLVAYVPAARAPHKLDRQQTSAEHRLAMLQLALREVDWAVILRDELERAADGRPSYTVETLEAIRERLPAAATMRLLIGADQVRIFEQWKSPERVIELAEPVVMLRPPETAESLLASLPDEASRRAWAGRLVEVDQMHVSSSMVRRRVARGQPIKKNVVDPAVARYIQEQGLYGIGGMSDG